MVSVAVNLATNTALIAYDPAVTGPRSCLEAVEGAGFEAALAAAGARMRSQAGSSAIATLLHGESCTASEFHMCALVGLVTACSRCQQPGAFAICRAAVG